MNPELGGVTLGWHLTHTAQDELFAAIEGTAFHTRVILERMEEHGVPIRRVINGGGIPQKNAVLNQVYANVLDKPILVPKGDVTSLGSAIFAFLAAGTFQTIEEAQDALCPGYRTVRARCRQAATSTRSCTRCIASCISPSAQGRRSRCALGDVLPELRRIAARVEEARMLEALRAEVSKPIWSWCAADWCSTRSATPAASRARTGWSSSSRAACPTIA